MTFQGIIVIIIEGALNMTMTRAEISKLTTHELAQLVGFASAELGRRTAPPAADSDIKMAPGERLALVQFGKRSGDTIEKAVRDLYAGLEHETLNRMERVFAQRDVEQEKQRAQLAKEITEAFRASAPVVEGAVIAPVKPVTKDGVQYLLCTGCGETWTRPAKRGRAPEKCGACL